MTIIAGAERFGEIILALSDLEMIEIFKKARVMQRGSKELADEEKARGGREV